MLVIVFDLHWLGFKSLKKASELSQLDYDYEVMDAAVRAGRPNEAWARLEESEVRICVEDAVLQMIKNEHDFKRNLHMFRMDVIEILLAHSICTWIEIKDFTS